MPAKESNKPHCYDINITTSGVVKLVQNLDPSEVSSPDGFSHYHLSLNREGCWGTTDDFATSFLHFSLFPTALRDLANSRPVHSLMLSSHPFLCLPCLLPLFSVPCKMVLARPDEGRHVHTTAVCVSLRRSGGLPLVRLPAGSWHGHPRWYA